MFAWTAMIIAFPAGTLEVTLNKSIELGTGEEGGGTVMLVQLTKVLVTLVPLTVTFTDTLRHGLVVLAWRDLVVLVTLQDNTSSKRYRVKLPPANDFTTTEFIAGHK
jgi:hypothetical protein